MEEHSFQKVLCIEDDSITLKFTKYILTKSSLAKEVLTASNGQEALELLNTDASANLDLILLDLNMPVMNGWEFLDTFTSHCQRKHPHLRVVIVSSSVFDDDFKKAKSYTFVSDFINKPFTVELAALLREKKAQLN